MESPLRQRITEMQNDICATAKPWLSGPELDDLRCLIRLTVEFHDWLQGSHVDKGPFPEVEFIAESTFSGVDSFYNVASAYKALVGAAPSAVGWDAMLMQSLREQFICKYQELLREGPFQPRCRLILDLFKIQIVVAGMLYN